MPYVQKDDRSFLEPFLHPLCTRMRGATVGMVNYVVTRLVTEVLLGENPRYADINAAIGVLECAKQELYRRVAAEYEDKKKEEHGDVYAVRVNITPY